MSGNDFDVDSSEVWKSINDDLSDSDTVKYLKIILKQNDAYINKVNNLNSTILITNKQSYAKTFIVYL